MWHHCKFNMQTATLLKMFYYIQCFQAAHLKFHYFISGYFYIFFFYPVRSSYSPIGSLSRWQIGKCSPDMVGTGEIKYPGRTKVASAALQKDIDLSKARGRKSQSQITRSSRLMVRRCASNQSPGKTFKKLKVVPNSLERTNSH